VLPSLAGVAGAVGAICVIFATKSAIAAGRGSGVNYKLYIAPLIFGLAPVINTVVSSFWHPERGKPYDFHFVMPGWKLWVGILLVGLGAALVLFAKEESESKHAPAPALQTTPEARPCSPRRRWSASTASWPTPGWCGPSSSTPTRCTRTRG